jgi:hypothetical protein
VLVDFLHVNRDIFTWSPSDMPGISREIQADVKPVKQRLCHFDEKRRAIGEEIHKLLKVRFIKEVFHPEWLANPILVRRKVESGGCMLITLV